jgi:hypothetical protein
VVPAVPLRLPLLLLLLLPAVLPAALQHGMEGVRDYSDGYPEAWFMPDGEEESPTRYEKVTCMSHVVTAAVSGHASIQGWSVP